MHWLLVFLGGGLGATLRHGVNRLAMATFGTGFPVGTISVNILGSVLIGLASGLFAAHGTSQPTRLFLVTGVLGGFTTFSAFSLDALTLWERGQPGVAALYVLASVALSLLGIVAGVAASRLF